MLCRNTLTPQQQRWLWVEPVSDFNAEIQTEVLLWCLMEILNSSLCLGMQLIGGISDPKSCQYDAAFLSKAKVITNNNNAE